jgi:hypothetical protein
MKRLIAALAVFMAVPASAEQIGGADIGVISLLTNPDQDPSGRKAR